MQVPKGRDHVSGGVSVPCQHATPVADALWNPIFSNVKFRKSNQGKGQELVLSNQGKESNSVRSQSQGKGHELVVYCMIECQWSQQ